VNEIGECINDKGHPGEGPVLSCLTIVNPFVDGCFGLGIDTSLAMKRKKVRQDDYREAKPELSFGEKMRNGTR